MKKMIITIREATLENRIKMKNLRCPGCGNVSVHVMFTNAIFSWDIYEGIDYFAIDGDTLHDAWVHCNYSKCEKHRHGWRLDYEVIPEKKKEEPSEPETTNN